MDQRTGQLDARQLSDRRLHGGPEKVVLFKAAASSLARGFAVQSVKASRPLRVAERPTHYIQLDGGQAPRRSASHVPEHSPPFQEPVPAVPESRPEPVALLLPALTVTVT